MNTYFIACEKFVGYVGAFDPLAAAAKICNKWLSPGESMTVLINGQEYTHRY